MVSMDSSKVAPRRRAQFEDLEATRVDLIEIYATLLRRLDEAKSAQWLAATAGFGVATAINIGNGESSIPPSQLATSIRQFESEVAHVRGVLAQVDARIAQVTGAMPGAPAAPGAVPAGVRRQ
jgi:hypothetical protein